MKNLAFEIVNDNNLGHYDIIELVTELLQYTIGDLKSDLRVKDNLYNEIKARYENLDNFAKRLQDNINDDTEIDVSEQDMLDIVAILDVFDGTEF